MARLNWLRCVCVLGVVVSVMAASRISAAESLDGKWKLLVLTYGDDAFLICDVDATADTLTANLVNAQRFFRNGAVALQTADNQLLLTVEGATMPLEFRAKLDDAALAQGTLLGAARFRDEWHPARLERTTDEKVLPILPSDTVHAIDEAKQATEVGERMQKLEALAKETPAPRKALVYAAIVGDAETAGWEPERVKQTVDQWLAEAAAYGPNWTGQSRTRILESLSGTQKYAALATDLARQAVQELSDDMSAEQRVAIVTRWRDAAQGAGDARAVAEAEDMLKVLETALDEEYLRGVPPFAPQKYAGRQDATRDRVVLCELFTGAQCPPCVAADVAFDALLQSYESTDVIGLQYHLHIPGPDPLVTTDSEARGAYYQTQGTPTFLCDGRAIGRGGGPMTFSEDKYTEYRQAIDPLLETSAPAAIELKASREGSKLHIDASTKVFADPNVAAPKLRLRLVLSEETIRYAGGNGLRFHHHVVRAMPGGVDGVEIAGDSAQTNVEVDLDALRTQLVDYVTQYGKENPFFATPPPVALEHLAVTAIVQNDSDRSVLQSKSVAVE